MITKSHTKTMIALTLCITTCPAILRTGGQMQEDSGQRNGLEYGLVSTSTNPTHLMTTERQRRCSLFGMFDGHGQCFDGTTEQMPSVLAACMLPSCFASYYKANPIPDHHESRAAIALHHAFMKVDMKIKQAGALEAGTTATVACVEPVKQQDAFRLSIANTGTSGATICNNDGTVIYTTPQHRASQYAPQSLGDSLSKYKYSHLCLAQQVAKQWTKKDLARDVQIQRDNFLKARPDTARGMLTRKCFVILGNQTLWQALSTDRAAAVAAHALHNEQDYGQIEEDNEVTPINGCLSAARALYYTVPGADNHNLAAMVLRIDPKHHQQPMPDRTRADKRVVRQDVDETPAYKRVRRGKKLLSTVSL